jgi:hypothetical protein
MQKLLGLLIVLIAATGLAGCGKKVTTENVLSDLVLSTHVIDADGSSSVTVTVTLYSKASADKRNIVFSTTGGAFTGGANGKVTVAADYKGEKLIATTTLKGPMAAGKIVITATPETTSPNGDYQLKDSIIANQVDPATIKLETSSFGIGANYINTDTLIGTLKSAQNKKVSLNAKVTFTDYIASNPALHGGFRAMQNSSDANSQVMVLYSAPAQLSIGTEILIKATIDANGASDIIKLTVNQ